MSDTTNETKLRPAVKRLLEAMKGSACDPINYALEELKKTYAETEPKHPAEMEWDEWCRAHVDIALGRSRDDRWVFLSGYRAGMLEAVNLVNPPAPLHDCNCCCIVCSSLCSGLSGIRQSIRDAAGKVPKE